MLAEKIKSIERTTNDVIKTLKELKSERVHQGNNGEAGKAVTYAKALKDGVVVIKPTRACSGEETIKVVKQQVNPAELGIGIKNIKEAKEGAVVIKCRNEGEAQKLRTNLEPKIRQNYVTTIPAKKNPRIKIVGLEEQYDEETLFKNLKLQNSKLVTKDSQLKLVVVKKMVKTFLAIIECDAKTFGRVMTEGEGRLFLGCKSCRCFEYIALVRCYNCNRYNHTSRECPNEKTCIYCGKAGRETCNCNKMVMNCTNCKISNEKYKLNLDIAHAAYDIKCPTYVWLQGKEKAKIQYDDNI